MSENQKFIIVLNFSNKCYTNFRMGIENDSLVKEVLNSDSDIYCGSNVINKEKIRTDKISYNDLNYSIEFDIAPFSGIVFEVKELTRT